MNKFLPRNISCYFKVLTFYIEKLKFRLFSSRLSLIRSLGYYSILLGSINDSVPKGFSHFPQNNENCILNLP
jgi:hypothetical protein